MSPTVSCLAVAAVRSSSRRWGLFRAEGRSYITLLQCPGDRNPTKKQLYQPESTRVNLLKSSSSWRGTAGCRPPVGTSGRHGKKSGSDSFSSDSSSSSKSALSSSAREQKRSRAQSSAPELQGAAHRRADGGWRNSSALVELTCSDQAGDGLVDVVLSVAQLEYSEKRKHKRFGTILGVMGTQRVMTLSKGGAKPPGSGPPGSQLIPP